MTQHNDNITLRQMFDMATEAIEFCQGRQREDFDQDRIWCLAIERIVLNIGEASTQLALATQESIPQVPWPQICAFRNRIVHGYDKVDHDRVWLILQNDIPSLITELEKLDLSSFE